MLRSFRSCAAALLLAVAAAASAPAVHAESIPMLMPADGLTVVQSAALGSMPYFVHTAAAGESPRAAELAVSSSGAVVAYFADQVVVEPYRTRIGATPRSDTSMLTTNLNAHLLPGRSTRFPFADVVMSGRSRAAMRYQGGATIIGVRLMRESSGLRR